MFSTFIASSDSNAVTTTTNENLTLKELLMTDGYVDLTFSILRRIAKTPREELIRDLIYKDMNVNRTKKIIESSEILDQLQDRVLIELYAENISMGSGWVFFEPEDGQSYAEITSLWKVSAEKQAQWDAEDARREAIMDWNDEEDWEWNDEEE
jgi:hypothetical protein